MKNNDSNDFNIQLLTSSINSKMKKKKQDAYYLLTLVLIHETNINRYFHFNLI